MIETKLSLSLLVPGATMLSSQECEKNPPKESYDEQVMLITYTKGKGKNKKEVKKPLVFKTRKQKLVHRSINICEEAYKHMLATPTSPKFSKPIKRNSAGEVVARIWDTMSEHERLKEHLDMIAHDLHAVSYNYEVFGD